MAMVSMAVLMSADTSPAERPDTLAVIDTSRVRSRRLIWLGPVDSTTLATWLRRTMRGAAIGVGAQRQRADVGSCLKAVLRAVGRQAHIHVIGLVIWVRASCLQSGTSHQGAKRRNRSVFTERPRSDATSRFHLHIQCRFVGFDTGVQVHQSGDVADLVPAPAVVRRSSSAVSAP